MNQFDIEAYLEGGLDAQEKKAFERQMRQDSDFAKEVKLQKMLASSLKTQLLREHITSALADDMADGKGDTTTSNGLPWRTILGGLGLLLAALAFLFLFNRNESVETPAPTSDTITQTEGVSIQEIPATPPPVNEEEKEPTIGTVPPEKQNPAPPAKKKSKPTKKKAPVQNRPIADAQPLPDLRAPSHPSPQVRGGNEEDAEHKALLDAIWYTNFPPANTSFNAPFDKAFDKLKERDFTSAYVRLQMLERKMPDNDSLFFLKGYTLLEMGEGVEAYNYLSKINQPPTDWQAHLDWYKGLAYLLANDQTQAAAVFENIKGQGKHLFQQESAKALELLK